MAPSNLFKLNSYKNTAAAIRTARVAAGLSSAEAAAIVNIHQPEYSRLENGKKQYMTERLKVAVEKLAAQLNVKVHFERANWSEIRQRGRPARAEKPAKREAPQKTDEDFWGATEGASPAAATLSDAQENIGLLVRLRLRGILSEDAFTGAVVQVVNNLPR